MRYQLLRYVAFGQDGDFDHAAMIERYNADLGKNLGNLLSRTLGLCAKLTSGKVPAYTPGDLERAFESQARVLIDAASKAWSDLAPHRALEETLALSSLANQYVDRAAPWAEAKKGDQTRVDTILALLLETLRALSVLVWPALPRKVGALRAQLGLPPLACKAGLDQWPALSFERAGATLGAASPLFPTVDKDGEKALLARLKPASEAAEAPVAGPGAVPGHPSAAREREHDQLRRVRGCGLARRFGEDREEGPEEGQAARARGGFGEPKPRTIIAGLALSFTPEALVGQRVIVVANLARVTSARAWCRTGCCSRRAQARSSCWRRCPKARPRARSSNDAAVDLLRRPIPSPAAARAASARRREGLGHQDRRLRGHRV